MANSKDWHKAESHPNVRVMTQLPEMWWASCTVYFDRKFNIFWLEDRSVNGPSSWYYWRLPNRSNRQ